MIASLILKVLAIGMFIAVVVFATVGGTLAILGVFGAMVDKFTRR